MVHYGRHIIDEKTGLCEICDRGAIHEIKHGKRPGRQFLYSNQDGKFTYRPSDEENYPPQEQQTPRYVRKPLYPEPPPPIRSRQPAHEEQLTTQRKPAPSRRTHSPVDDRSHHHATLYYVDNSGQMYRQNNGPSHEPPRHIPQQQQQPPPPRPQQTRTIQRRAQTPPPGVSDTWRSPPRRQHKSDTEILPQQSYRARPNDNQYDHSPRRAEMFYIQRPHAQSQYDDRSPPLRNPQQPANNNRRPRQLEPIDQNHRREPEQTFVRKVYRKLPPNRSEPREDEYVPTEYHPRTTRKVEKYYPSPQLTQRQNQAQFPNKYASAYHIQSDYVY